MSLQEGRQQQHSGLLSLKPLGAQKKAGRNRRRGKRAGDKGENSLLTCRVVHQRVGWPTGILQQVWRAAKKEVK